MTAYREHYFPNTEPLGKDEMRITALGTGRPFLRPCQANAGWLVELGSGDKFQLDFGYGTQKQFRRAGDPLPVHDRLFRHPSSHRPCGRLRPGLDRQLGGRPHQAARGLRPVRAGHEVRHEAFRRKASDKR